MKLSSVLPFFAIAKAFVLPDERTFGQLSVQNVFRPIDQTVDNSKNTLDEAFQSASDAGDLVFQDLESAYVSGWLNGGSLLSQFKDDFESHEDADEEDFFSHPHHPHHPHHSSNMTVYQLISESKYTTKLAKLISEYDDIVDVLNGTAANYTVFAPTDKAFEKLPKHHKPSKELVKDILLYHVSPEFHPAPEILAARTIPALYREVDLGMHAPPQRLNIHLSLKGVVVNWYARVIAPNIFGLNGVIHGVDSLIFPPPKVLTILDLLPGEFSTLELGLEKTGLYDYLKDAPHKGGTFFAPSNFAFMKLGPKVNAFLFSKYGQKYLAALLKYHVVFDQTLYSNAYYDGEDKDMTSGKGGLFHIDLPTLLEDRYLGIDVAKYGPFTEIKINGFVRVSVSDGIAKDGVVHVVSDVLIPPKKLGGVIVEDEELDVEDLIERLEPYANAGAEL